MTVESWPLPVQPVSSTPFVDVPVNLTNAGQAHVQLLQVKSVPVFEAAEHVPLVPALRSQSSPGSTTPLPQRETGVDVAVGVGDAVRVAVAVPVAVTVGVAV